MSKSGKFLLGALLGAGAAVLLTPVTGKKARSSLRNLAEKKGLDAGALQSKAESLLARGAKLVQAIKQEEPPKPKRKTKIKK